MIATYVVLRPKLECFKEERSLKIIFFTVLVRGKKQSVFQWLTTNLQSESSNLKFGLIFYARKWQKR